MREIKRVERLVKSGDIVFFHTAFKWSKPSTWLSWCIQKIAGVTYNHVGIVIKNWDKPFINEASGNGVTSTPLEKRLYGRYIQIRRPVNTIDEKSFCIHANSFLNYTKYDFRGLLLDQLIWHLLGIWPGAKTEEEATKRLYCYEYYWLMYASYFSPKWWQQLPRLTIDIPQTEIVYQT